jgi:hypothetical protein
MADCQIKYTSKTSPHHERITHLGSDTWTWARERVIRSIEDGSNTFFTLERGKRADVAIVNGAGGKYLRTRADGQWNDNLLALPSCVVAAA